MYGTDGHLRDDLERLKQPDIATAYAQHLEAALPDEGELGVAPLEDCWRIVKAAINNVAEDIVGYEERRRRNDWFDKECRAVLEEKNAARAVMLQHGTRQNVERYKQKRRQQTRLFQEKKRRLEEAECEEMGLLYRSQDTRKIYQKLNASHKDDQGNGGFDYVSAVEDRNEPTTTLREVKDAIQQLKNNKAAGKDGIAAELIKLGPEKLATCLHRLVVKIWKIDQLPEEWKEGVICHIDKKGDHLEAGMIDLDPESRIKALSLHWEPSTEQLRYKIQHPPSATDAPLTKRVALSYIARLFDPLGLVEPVITSAKTFMHSLDLEERQR
ncbi:uncharacterized protein LOC131686875 [Topomyia yanbarensis]|uniref:uncharacterized protein LOC131686875 n=1 Tax=Topomyia yanbarensis TaxID=2498891 RepID=UPI00273B5A77|nr:uncharacterized protein LOC131686875 [Topomyia yanbarensis]